LHDKVVPHSKPCGNTILSHVPLPPFTRRQLRYNHRVTTKQLIKRLIDRLPKDATIEDVQYRIYVLQKIQAGEADASAGRLVPHDNVMKDLQRWLKSSGRRARKVT
jgi:predicted transcriptional regulator